MKNLFLIAFITFLFASCAKEAADSASQPGKSGSITRFAVYQNFMYVLNHNEVQTYDITDKEHPALVHTLPITAHLEEHDHDKQ